MSTFPTIEKLVATAVKGGHNEKDAKGVIEKSYEYLKDVYFGYAPKKLVHIAYVLY